MKKIFFLIAFLFAVVCYSAPPPDKPFSFLTADIGVIRSQGDIASQALEVQEVNPAYIGNESCLSLSVTIDKPVANWGFINRLHDRKADKQNTNFGYPFGANF